MPEPRARFLSIKDASAVFGCSQTLLRRWIDNGTLTAYRPTRDKVLISVDELEAHILASANAPAGNRGLHLRRGNG